MNPIIKTRELSERWKIPYHSARTITLTPVFPKPINETGQRRWLLADVEKFEKGGYSKSSLSAKSSGSGL